MYQALFSLPQESLGSRLQLEGPLPSFVSRLYRHLCLLHINFMLYRIAGNRAVLIFIVFVTDLVVTNFSPMKLKTVGKGRQAPSLQVCT